MPTCDRACLEVRAAAAQGRRQGRRERAGLLQGDEHVRQAGHGDGGVQRGAGRRSASTSTRSSASASRSRRSSPARSLEMPVSFYVDPAIVDGRGRQGAARDDAVLHVLSGRARSSSRPWRRATGSGRMTMTRAGTGTRLAKELSPNAVAAAQRPTRPIGSTNGDYGRQEMAETHAKHHDYHLVDPSPWPVAGRAGGVAMAVGLIIWMRSMDGGPACSASTAPGSSRSGSPASSPPPSCGGATSSARPTGRPYAGRAAAPPLRHDPVHRLGGDVLRRLVLGLFRRGAVSRRRARRS